MNVLKIAYSVKWTFFEENSKKFRLLTLFSFIIAFTVEKFLNTDGHHQVSFFMLVMVAAGMSSFSILQQAIISYITVGAMLFLSPFGMPGAIFFMMQWFSHFIICFVISYLIKVHIKEQANTINFIKTLVKTIESKDRYTASHSMNVANYSKAIAERLNYSKKDCETIYIGALLHDIGKIGIQDNVLNKPGKLTEKEYRLIQQHPAIGNDMLKLIEMFQEEKILDMILYHHERFDGKGYPKKLKNAEIPECAAIVAVADAYDAMISKRVYREGHDADYAIEELKRNSGSQFNPVVVNVFVEHISLHIDKLDT